MASDDLLRWGRKKKLIYTKYPIELDEKHVEGKVGSYQELERSGSCVMPEVLPKGNTYKKAYSNGRMKAKDGSNDKLYVEPASLNCFISEPLEPISIRHSENNNDIEFTTNHDDASSSQNSQSEIEEKNKLRRDQSSICEEKNKFRLNRASICEENISHKRSAIQAMVFPETSDFKRKTLNSSFKNLGPSMCRERRLLQQHLLPESMKIPKLHLSLSFSEKAKDFASFGQSKFSNRPNIRRSKAVESRIQQITPGAFLSNVCMERYAVKEKPHKKNASGLKAMAMKNGFKKL